LFRETAQRLGIEHRPTTAYNPQGDGLTERMNRTIKDALQCYTSLASDDWDLFVDDVLRASRSVRHSTTGHSPFELLYGVQPALPMDKSIPVSVQDNALSTAVVSADPKERQYMLDVLRADAAAHILYKQAQAKKYHDSRLSARMVVFAEGDLVMVRNMTARRTKIRQWEGPYRVLRVVNATVLKLQHCNNAADIDTVNIARVKHFRGDPADYTDPPPQTQDPEAHWEVETILDSRMTEQHGIQYLVHFRGWRSTEDRWVSPSEGAFDELIRAYERKQQHGAQADRLLRQQQRQFGLAAPPVQEQGKQQTQDAQQQPTGMDTTSAAAVAPSARRSQRVRHPPRNKDT
jgi:hypothetical protein